jgi:hypothetical protein
VLSAFIVCLNEFERAVAGCIRAVHSQRRLGWSWGKGFLQGEVYRQLHQVSVTSVIVRAVDMDINRGLISTHIAMTKRAELVR